MKEILLENAIKAEKILEKQRILIDSDNDGIPDEWEINGYTVENGLIVPWNEEKHKEIGLYKYFSDPYDSHTAGGPYSDTEKVLAKFDGLNEATHPLIASYPRIIVEMEKIILSKNVTISQDKQTSASKETSNTVSISTSNSHTDSTTVGASVTASVEVSMTPSASVSVTANFSTETSNTVTAEKSSSSTAGQTLGESITKSLSLNESDAAFLNANIRYINIGTMPIYNFKPTLNFVLGIGEKAQTIATISAKSNTFATVILPEEKYPKEHQNAVAWNTSDDFNSQPIKLNYDQVMAIANGEPLQIQVTQIEGEYKKYDADGNHYVLQDFKWEYALSDIYRKTALITIAFKDGQTFERRVAVRSFKRYNLQTSPEIKLGDAMKLAFPGLEIIKNKIYYKNRILDKENLQIVFTKFTELCINKQGKKPFFDINLEKEMDILFVEENKKLQPGKKEDDLEIKIDYQERPAMEEFNIIKEKLEFFNGMHGYNSFFDLKHSIEIYSKDLDHDGQILSHLIKDYLLKSNISQKSLNKLTIKLTGNSISKRQYDDNNTFGVSSFADPLTSLTHWFKFISLKYEEVLSPVDNFQLFCRNYPELSNLDKFRKRNENQEKNFYHEILSLLNYFNSEKYEFFDEKHCFNLNNIINLQTNLGFKCIYLKEIIKAYLLCKGFIPIAIINKLNINFQSKFSSDNSSNTLKQFGFERDVPKNWFLMIEISISDFNIWYQQHETYYKDYVPFLMNNITWSDDKLSNPNYIIEDPFFETLFQTYPDEVERLEAIAKKLNLI